MTTYNVIKNVSPVEDISISISNDYGVKYPVARIIFPITFTVAAPLLNLSASAVIDASITFTVGTPSSTTTAAPTYVYNSSAGDAYISGTRTYNFYGSTTSMVLGHTGPVYINDQRFWYFNTDWIPFTLTDIANGTTIISAILTLTASTIGTTSWAGTGLNRVADGEGYPLLLKFACQQIGGDVAAPTTYDDLNSRVMTNNYTGYSSIPLWVVDTEYTFDITTSVQEIVNRAAWGVGEGKKLGVMIMNNGSWRGESRSVYTFENGSKYPTLSITT